MIKFDNVYDWLNYILKGMNRSAVYKIFGHMEIAALSFLNSDLHEEGKEALKKVKEYSART